MIDLNGINFDSKMKIKLDEQQQQQDEDWLKYNTSAEYAIRFDCKGNIVDSYE